MNIGILSNILKESSINNNKVLGNSLEKLSTGLQINKASDNASGLAISDKLRTQASGIKQGIDNANSAIAMMNIADKSMSELSNILDTIKAKAIQMNTDTTNEDGRKIIKTDILKLIENYDDIVCRTNYNQTPLLNGCASPFDFQVGDDSNEIISVNVDSVESRQMGESDPYKLKNFITGFNSIPIFSPSGVLSEEIGLVGQTGVVRVNFSWNENIDLDPIVVDPNGDAMGYNASWPEGDTNLSPNSTDTGGLWDVDDTGGLAPNQENFYWANSAPIGDYNFYIRNFSNNWPSLNPIDVAVTIKTADTIVIRSLSIPVGTQDIGPFIFNYDGSSNTTTSSSETSSCTCDYTDLIRNDDSPTLAIQAQNLMRVIDEALSQLNAQRANVGAGTNQLESSARNHVTNYVNIKNAESIIRDVNYSEEIASFNKENIISQAGSFAQSQANEIDKQYVVQLLK